MASVIRNVAQHLGNTVSVALGSYVHPAIVSHYQAGGSFPPRKAGQQQPAQSKLRYMEKRVVKLIAHWPRAATANPTPTLHASGGGARRPPKQRPI